VHPNHEFVLAYARDHTRGRVLDYGCGAGEVVAEGLRRGLDIEGAELFFAGGDTRAAAEATGLLGTRIHELSEGRVAAEDGRYDLVVSNQVLEHVEDLDAVLDELARVLAPGGRMLCLFPSREVWREGHCGVPFLHRLPPRSPLTRRYAAAAHRAGLGSYRGGDGAEWAERVTAWVERYCHYRSRREILRSYARHFEVEPLEEVHAAFRLEPLAGARAAAAVRLPVVRSATRFASRRLAHLTFVARKRA
jgi:SAM-dependent methyltransferase